MTKKTILIILTLCLGLNARAGVVVRPDSLTGPIKPMNAVNNGPVVSGVDQKRDNFAAYKALAIPYARTHDSNYFNGYGAPHTVDITAVFPDFKADEKKASSYDFTNTDAYLKTICAAGTQVFFRLGQSIEHTVRKYGVYPPADFKKWARICEHVIRHYNEGWADGFNMGIEYWEIWNEPDLDSDEVRRTAPRTWGGTDEQFYDLFEITSKHLKRCFPNLKIGGPASCGNEKWAASFLAEMSARKVPMDFFSWHIYHNKPAKVTAAAGRFRRMMDENGYADAESILNEWNYIKGWTDTYVYSIETISNLKGAAFTAAVMAGLQNAPLDMAMYYDFRPSVFCGPFDMYTYKVHEPYYAFYAWNRLAGGMSLSVDVNDADGDLWCVASRKDDGHISVLLVRYNEDNNILKSKDVTVEIPGFSPDGRICGYLTDSSHIYSETPLEPGADGRLSVCLEPNAFVLIEL